MHSQKRSGTTVSMITSQEYAGIADTGQLKIPPPPFNKNPPPQNLGKSQNNKNPPTIFETSKSQKNKNPSSKSERPIPDFRGILPFEYTVLPAAGVKNHVFAS